jgi:hypothetical protein
MAIKSCLPPATSEVIEVPSKEKTPYFSSDDGNDERESGKEEGNYKGNDKDGMRRTASPAGWLLGRRGSCQKNCIQEEGGIQTLLASKRLYYLDLDEMFGKDPNKIRRWLIMFRSWSLI